MPGVPEPNLERKGKLTLGNSLAVQWLGLCALTAGGTGSIPDGGIKILQAPPGVAKKSPRPISTALQGLTTATGAPQLSDFSLAPTPSLPPAEFQGDGAEQWAGGKRLQAGLKMSVPFSSLWP